MADERAVDRIVDLETTTSPLATDYVPVDSTNQGTRRLSFPNLADKTLDELNTKDFNISTVGNRTIPAHIRVLNERISNIITPSGQPSLSELVDIRTNFLGETFASAGDAVRCSDLIASGYIRLSINSEAASGSWYRGFFNIERLKGGRIAAIVDVQEYPTLLPEGGSLLALSQVPYYDSAAGQYYYLLSDTDTDEPSHRVSNHLYNYSETTIMSDASGAVAKYRVLVTFDIPEDIDYPYICMVYRTDVPFLGEHLIAMGAGIHGNTYSDPSQDGNIVIS